MCTAYPVNMRNKINLLFGKKRLRRGHISRNAFAFLGFACLMLLFFSSLTTGCANFHARSSDDYVYKPHTYPALRYATSGSGLYDRYRPKTKSSGFMIDGDALFKEMAYMLAFNVYALIVEVPAALVIDTLAYPYDRSAVSRFKAGPSVFEEALFSETASAAPETLRKHYWPVACDPVITRFLNQYAAHTGARAKIMLLIEAGAGLPILAEKAHLDNVAASALFAAAENMADVRDKLLGRIEDNALIAERAQIDKDPKLRIAALNRLSDENQHLFAKIATQDSDGYVRKEAISRLDDQDLLAQLAIGDPSGGVREHAAERITNQVLLAAVFTRTAYEPSRRAVLRNFTDQGLLAKIFESSTDKHMRCAAVEAIDDHALLAWIARHDKESDVRSKAVGKLTDQKLLAELAVTDPSDSVCRLASDKVNDPAALAHIAFNSPSQPARLAAIQRLKDDPVTLGKVALQDQDWLIRDIAVEGVVDQALLAHIAISDTQPNVRESAVCKLDDQQLLFEINKHDKNGHVRAAALRHLKDKALLARIAMESDNVDFRKDAIERIADDQDTLTKIAFAETDTTARRFAVGKIRQEATLARIAMEDVDLTIGMIALERIKNKSPLLPEIAAKSRHERVRQRAKQKYDY